MEIAKLSLTNFRNYEKLEIYFPKKFNIIYGNNGSGKSNLIEAIYFLSITKSFRTNDENMLIKHGTIQANVKGDILVRKNKTSYESNLSKDNKNVYIDGDKIDRLSNYVSKIKIVLFNPLDTKFISDSPSTRRKLVNISISQIDQSYIDLLNNYNKILKNRNMYLKNNILETKNSKMYYDILTNKLIEYGLKIHEKRANYCEIINKYLETIYKDIFTVGVLKLKYVSDYKNKSAEELERIYKKDYQKEIEYKKAIHGVHHDDFELLLNGINIREYGSVGQQKNSIISLKLSELKIMSELNNDTPILILDDLFSELDKEKVNNIIAMLDEKVQTFITTTNIENINQELLAKCDLYEVTESKVERK